VVRLLLASSLASQFQLSLGLTVWQAVSYDKAL
jgi:hypothetical protein